MAFQTLQPVSRQERERSQIGRRIQHVQFPQARTLKGFEPAYSFPMEEALSIRAAESPDHLESVYCYSVNVKRYDIEGARPAAKRRRKSRVKNPTRKHGVMGHPGAIQDLSSGPPVRQVR